MLAAWLPALIHSIVFRTLRVAELQHVVSFWRCCCRCCSRFCLVVLFSPYIRAERQLKEDAERQRVDAEAEEHEAEEALRSTRQELATVSRELLDH
jgi:hypothetical protein